MATIRLIPSTYAVSSSSYLSVSNADNMYHNTDNTTYATITNTYASTSSRYLYLRGFNFDDIPSGAIINSFEVKIKGYESGLSTSTSYAPRLANGSSAISNTTATTNFGTSTKTITIPTGALTWEQIVNYGSNFTIMAYVRRSSRNTTGYFYCYGAEIEVDYTIPIYHNVTITGDNVTPTGTKSILEGEDLKIRCSDTEKPTVTDNGVDVTSRVVQETDTGASYDVTNVSTTYGFAVNGSGYYESNNQGHSNSAAVCRIDFDVPVEATITFSVINYAESTYDYGLLSNIDTSLSTSASADSSGVHWSGQNNNSSSVQTVTYTMAAGEHYIYAKYFKDNYTDDNNDSFQFKIAITLNEPFTPGTYWVYTLSNITTNHTVVFTAAGIMPFRVKQNGTWITPSKVLVKQNGSWVQASKVMVKQNGTWQ